jgi:hypothetical protein
MPAIDSYAEPRQSWIGALSRQGAAAPYADDLGRERFPRRAAVDAGSWWHQRLGDIFQYLSP